MNAKKFNVFLLQGIIPSYRVPVFRRISELEDVNLTVFYSDPSNEQRNENLKSAENISGFRHIKLPRIVVRSSVLQFGILKYIVRERPQVVVSGKMGQFDTVFILLLCKLMGIRLIWFQGGVPYIDPAKNREYASRGLMNRVFGRYNPRRLLSLRADGLICYTDHAKRYYRDMGFPENHVWVAHNSTDTDALDRYRREWTARPEMLERERVRLSPGGDPLVLLIGRLNAARRLDTLLFALKRLADAGVSAALAVVGDGGERARYEKLAGKLGLSNVNFEGAVYDERELCRYLLVSDIFVVPGVASLALKMAMAMGRPVISVDHGLEVHDIEEGVNGFTFPLGDDESLAEKLEPLLTSRELSGKIGDGGLSTVRDKVNIHTMVEGFHRAIVDKSPRDISDDISV